MAAGNEAWNLQSFLGALVVELDRAQDRLALKAATGRRLSYSVKDVALDLQIFPVYSGNAVRFVTAQPGQQGASRINIQLGSITDRMIRETTREPARDDDLLIRDLPGVDEATKKTLQAVGVESARDLERLEDQKVSLKAVIPDDQSYRRLADLIRASRREKQAPRVERVALEQTAAGEPVLVVHGENLQLDGFGAGEGYPAAACGGHPVEVLGSDPRSIRLRWPGPDRGTGPHDFVLALDPFAVVRFRLGRRRGDT